MIYYCFERKTGRFAGSGTVRIRTATHDSTTKAPNEGAVVEEEMDWQWMNGGWLRKPALEITDLAPARKGGHIVSRVRKATTRRSK